MPAPFASQKRQQSEDPGIRCTAKGKRRQLVDSPPQGTHYVPGIGLDRLERCIQSGATHRVEDNIEAFATRMLSHILRDRRCLIVDGGGAELFGYSFLVRGN